MFVYVMEDHTAPNVTKIGVSNNPERREREVWMVTTRARYKVADRYIANLIESMAQAFAIRKCGRAYRHSEERDVWGSQGYTEFFKCTVKQAMGFILRAYQLFQRLGYDALRSYRRKFCRIHGIQI
jgi:hypothetical protein